MKNPKLASRYANALYDFAVEQNQVEKVYQDTVLIKKTILENPELKTVLESPIIPQEKKQKIVTKIFATKLDEISLRFFALIVKKRREPQVAMICEQFQKIYYNNHNIKEATIISAQPLSDKMVAYLKDYMEQGTPYSYIFHLLVDAEIIGGIVVKVEDFYFDASIQAKINKLKGEFSQNKFATGF